GAGGAFVAWSDDRTGSSDIRVQRLSPSGALDWDPDGVAMGTVALGNYSLFPLVSADGAGGALVAYPAFGGSYARATIQRLSQSGTPLWAAGGVSASTSSLGTNCVGLGAGGPGGALLAVLGNRAANPFRRA